MTAALHAWPEVAAVLLDRLSNGKLSGACFGVLVDVSSRRLAAGQAQMEITPLDLPVLTMSPP
eukprot:363974-Chlamydomonas_euryale.AAC.18